MRLQRLELTNFRSHTALDLDLGQLQAAAIVGPNGAGKSSIFVAIDWCLYGGESGDALLQHTAKTGGVTLELDVGGERWRVNRGRERGKKSWLVVERGVDQGWAPVPFNHIADAQAFLDEHVLSMSQEAWRASVYAPQGDAGVLAAMRPGERKALLGGLLGLDQYEEWRELASAEARAAKERALILESQAEMEEERAVAADAKAAKLNDWATFEQAGALQLEALENELQEALDRRMDAEKVERRHALVAQMRQIKERGVEAKARNAERQELGEKLAATEGAQADFAQWEAKRDAHLRAVADATGAADAVLAELRAAEGVVTSAERAMDGAKDRWKQAKDYLDGLEVISEVEEPQSENCPTCGQEIHGEAAEKAAAAAAEQRRQFDLRVEDARKRLVSAADELRAAQDAVRDARVAAEAVRERAEAAPAARVPEFDQDGFEQARSAAMARVTLEGQIAGLGAYEDVDGLKSEWSRLKSEAEELPESVPDGRSPQAVQGDLDQLRANLNDAQREKHAAEAAKEAAEAHRTAQAQLLVEAGEQDLLRAARELVAAACSRNGIPAMMLDNATGGIEAAANDALSSLGSALKIRIVTQVAKQSGKGTKETLEILVDDGMLERPLESFSGGERYRAHVALRMGLAATLSAGSRPCDVLLIDEPTDLDKEGVQLLSELLAGVPAQVLLVTHLDELVHAMPQRVLVERGSAAESKVTVL